LAPTAKIAANLGSTEKEQFWQQAADEVRSFITKTYWNDKDQHFCSDSNCKRTKASLSFMLALPCDPS
jgi:neutral trehalase